MGGEGDSSKLGRVDTGDSTDGPPLQRWPTQIPACTGWIPCARAFPAPELLGGVRRHLVFITNTSALDPPRYNASRYKTDRDHLNTHHLPPASDNVTHTQRRCHGPNPTTTPRPRSPLRVLLVSSSNPQNRRTRLTPHNKRKPT